MAWVHAAASTIQPGQAQCILVNHYQHPHSAFLPCLTGTDGGMNTANIAVQVFVAHNNTANSKVVPAPAPRHAHFHPLLPPLLLDKWACLPAARNITACTRAKWGVDMSHLHDGKWVRSPRSRIVFAARGAHPEPHESAPIPPCRFHPQARHSTSSPAHCSSRASKSER